MMAKNSHFFMEFWPIFDIATIFMFQMGCFGILLAGHTKETWWWWAFLLLSGPPYKTGDGPKMAKHGRLINVSKGSTMVEPSVLDHLGWSGPFCTILDKNKFFAPNGQSKVWRRCLLEVGDNLSDSIQCFYLKIIQTNIRFKMAHPKFNSIYYTIRNKSANFFLIN